MALSGSSTLRRLVVTAGLLAMLGALLPAAAAYAQVAGRTNSADGELFVVAINAKQRELDTARMDGLVNRLVNHTTHAPDAIFVTEIIRSNLVLMRDQLNAAMPEVANYQIVGISTKDQLDTDSNIKVKILLNTKTMTFGKHVTWVDVCTTERTYQLVTAHENLADGTLGRSVALAGVHFAPSFNPGGSVECKEQNAAEARRQMAEHADSGIMGDFNRRATTKYYECNPNELGTLEPWYETMTGPSTVDGRIYRDTVRAAHFGQATMPDQWSWERETSETLCTGLPGYKRSRLDYIFVSDEMTPLNAGTDQGWATANGGGVVCDPLPGCKYSDHRFLWANVKISTHDQGATRPEAPTVAAPVVGGAAVEGQLDVTWTGTGATSYDVYRYDAAEHVRNWVWRGAATPAIGSATVSYNDVDTAMNPGGTYHYRVVGVTTSDGVASYSRPSPLGTGTAAGTPNAPPVVTITSPADAASHTARETTAGGGVQLTFTAGADEGVSTWAWSDGTTDSAGDPITISRDASFNHLLHVGTHTLTATATDSEGASGSDTITVTVNPYDAVAVASGETAVAGTVHGTYQSTWKNDDTDQVITEVQSGGKPATRYYYLEHIWTFDVEVGAAVTLTGVATSNEDYNVSYSVNGGAYVALPQVLAGGSGFSFSLADDTAGTVNVRIQDAGRVGDTTATALRVDHLSISSQPATTPPAAPEPVVATVTSSTTVDVKWSNVARESGYVVQWTATPSPADTDWQVLAEPGVDVTAVSHTSLSAGTTYSYRVRAWNEHGTSAWTAAASASPTDAPQTRPMTVALDGTAASKPKGMWTATVTATVTAPDGSGNAEPVSGADVHYTWNDSNATVGSCRTGADGTCVASTDATKQQSSLTYTVTNVTHTDTTLTYTADPAPSHTVLKP